MFGTDFVFAGERLSDYGFIICVFDGVEPTVSGGDVTLATIKPPSSNVHTLYATSFEEPLSFTFSIGKKYCGNDPHGDFLTQEDQSSIMRWLQRVDKYHWLTFDQEGWEDICFHAHFNLQPHYAIGRCIGYDVVVTTDSPYGYSQEQHKKFNLKVGESYNIIDYSDIPGYIYPRSEITVLSGDENTGVISIQTGCESYNKYTTILNASKGDIITLDKNNNIISGINRLNDFSFTFPVIANSYTLSNQVGDILNDLGRLNTITNAGNVDVNIDMKYRYIRRVHI